MTDEPRTGQPATTNPAAAVTFGEALRVWLKIGLLSFGGPAGQIALMHRILVDEKRWVGEQRFLHALNYCMLLPGPEAQQLACYVGWLLHRTWGGIVAGALFVVPGFLVVLALSWLYVGAHGTPWVAALFYGLKPAVIAIVLAALLRIGKRALTNRMMLVLAGLAFLAIAVVHVPFPFIVAGAVLIGFIGGRRWPALFAAKPGHAAATGGNAGIADQAAHDRTAGWGYVVGQISLWGVLWLAPVAVLWLALGGGHVLTQLATFFSQAALVTFGGAYAVLAYIGQAAVGTYGWLEPGEMLDGLGMAETAPGPLIKVVQFVGFLAAYRQGGGDPLLLATLGAVLVTWVTFIPSYLYIFAGAPFIERLRGNVALAAALGAVTAAVVGVILNLALWFALHTVFGEHADWTWGVARVEVPVWASVDWAALVLSLLASVAMLRFRLGVLPVLGACVVLGGAWRLLMG
jgi:chromate transporter